MAKNGFRVIDSDMHVVEPPDLWQRYWPEGAPRTHVPVGTATGFPRDIGVTIDGIPTNRPGIDSIAWGKALYAHMEPSFDDYAFAEHARFDAASQLEAMDREGIDIGVQYPSRGLFVLGADTSAVDADGLDPAVATAIARAYNDWLADFCAEDPERMIGAGMVAPHDVAAAVDETRRVVEDLGFRSIFLLPGIVGGRPWHHPDYDTLWAECERQNIPVVFHGGGPDRLTDFGLGHGDLLMMWHTFSHSLGPMSALVSFCGGGVFDRFPRLRAGFLEANCSWAPWLLHRLDEHYDEYIGRFEITLSKDPSEFFRSNCWVSVEADEAPATLYVQALGNDNVVFSTDYPHPDSKFPRAVDAFLAGALDDESKRKFLWDNCARLYNLNVG